MPVRTRLLQLSHELLLDVVVKRFGSALEVAGWTTPEDSQSMADSVAGIIKGSEQTQASYDGLKEDLLHWQETANNRSEQLQAMTRAKMELEQQFQAIADKQGNADFEARAAAPGLEERLKSVRESLSTLNGKVVALAGAANAYLAAAPIPRSSDPLEQRYLNEVRGALIEKAGRFHLPLAIPPGERSLVVSKRGSQTLYRLVGADGAGMGHIVAYATSAERQGASIEVYPLVDLVKVDAPSAESTIPSRDVCPRSNCENGIVFPGGERCETCDGAGLVAVPLLKVPTTAAEAAANLLATLPQTPPESDDPFDDSAIGAGGPGHSRVDAPWTQAQVDCLNAYQRSGVGHPFTGERGPGGEETILIATQAGWVEVTDGPVVQTWAHRFMAEWSTLDALRADLVTVCHCIGERKPSEVDGRICVQCGKPFRAPNLEAR